MTEDWRDARIAELERELADLTDASLMVLDQRKQLQARIAELAQELAGLAEAATLLRDERDEMKSRHDFVLEANKHLAEMLERARSRKR